LTDGYTPQRNIVAVVCIINKMKSTEQHSLHQTLSLVLEATDTKKPNAGVEKDNFT